MYLCMYVYHMHAGVLRSERASNTLALELQAVVNNHVGVRTKTPRSYIRAVRVPNNRVFSSIPRIIYHIYTQISINKIITHMFSSCT